MTKKEFLLRLSEALAGLPEDELNERLDFYSEIIDDRIDDCHSEEDAVADVGSVEDIINHILSETPITKIIKEKVKPARKMKTWEIILIILGFPMWFPLLVAFGAVILSVYISIWSVIISLWATFVSFAACSAAGLIAGVGLMIYDSIQIGLAVLSSGLVLAGLSVFAFFGCKAITNLTVTLTGKFIIWLKARIMRKEAVK